MKLVAILIILMSGCSLGERMISQNNNLANSSLLSEIKSRAVANLATENNMNLRHAVAGKGNANERSSACPPEKGHEEFDKWVRPKDCRCTGNQGPCIAVQDSPGQRVECPHGWAADKFCSGGSHQDCNYVQAYLECNVDVRDYVSSEKKWVITQDTAGKGYPYNDNKEWFGCDGASSSTDGASGDSTTNAVVTGMCTSGENKDCSSGRQAVQCTQLKHDTTITPLSGVHGYNGGELCVDLDGKDWIQNQGHLTNRCPGGSLLTRISTSGKSKDVKCGNRWMYSAGICKVVVGPNTLVNDPTSWKMKWSQAPRTSYCGEEGCTLSITQGVEKSSTYGETNEHSISHSIGVSASVGFEFGGASSSVERSYTLEMASTVSNSYEYSTTHTTELTFDFNCKRGKIWQYSAAGKKDDGEEITINTNQVRCGLEPPVCPPAFCTTNPKSHGLDDCSCCKHCDWASGDEKGNCKVC